MREFGDLAAPPRDIAPADFWEAKHLIAPFAAAAAAAADGNGSGGAADGAGGAGGAGAGWPRADDGAGGADGAGAGWLCAADGAGGAGGSRAAACAAEAAVERELLRAAAAAAAAARASCELQQRLVWQPAEPWEGQRGGGGGGACGPAPGAQACAAVLAAAAGAAAGGAEPDCEMDVAPCALRQPPPPAAPGTPEDGQQESGGGGGGGASQQRSGSGGSGASAGAALGGGGGGGGGGGDEGGGGGGDWHVAECLGSPAESGRRRKARRRGAPRGAEGDAGGPGASARRRLLAARVSVYCDACSAGALAAANEVMARIRLPGGLPYAPVAPDSPEFAMAAAWQLPAFAVALGSSYFQRLLAALPHLAGAAAQLPEFARLLEPHTPGAPAPPAFEGDLFDVEATLRSAQFTCVFLATKVADQVHAYGLLCSMLTSFTAQRAPATLEQAAEVELACLAALGWWLGPYFGEEALGDNSDDLVDLFCGN
ncbi:MAG: hypothetical protein J3K34DRAFT_498165 [Monoraphidium minutum]|nr:MAG: hypothetical protein J3K34DRAFT_498165 [Monoraphidium minutum]